MVNLTRINLNFSGNYPAIRAKNSIRTSFGENKSAGDVVDISPQELPTSKYMEKFKEDVDRIKNGHYENKREKNILLKKFAEQDIYSCVNIHTQKDKKFEGMHSYMKILSRKDEKLEAMEYLLSGIDQDCAEKVKGKKIKSGRIDYIETCSAFTQYLQYFAPEERNEVIEVLAGYIKEGLNRKDKDEVMRAGLVYKDLTESMLKFPPHDKLKAVETITNSVIDTPSCITNVKGLLQHFINLNLVSEEKDEANKLLAKCSKKPNGKK